MTGSWIYSDPNRIPAAPIVRVVTEYLKEEGEEGAELTSLRLLAERVDVKENTLGKIFQGVSKTMDFDLADRLLCVLNLHDLWLTDLNDLYNSVRLQDGEKLRDTPRASGMRVCGAAGCSVLFSKKTGGGQDREYCSERCRRRAADARKRARDGRKPRYSNHFDKCIHGHDWTPENIYWFGVKKDGTKRRRCKACVRARQAHSEKRGGRLED